MILVSKVLTMEELEAVKKKYGKYVKVTADIEKGLVVLGPQLHADALVLLKEQGSAEENIWGGWVDLENGEIDFNAVWNIRPQLANPAMELLDTDRREKFSKSVKNLLEVIWK